MQSVQSNTLKFSQIVLQYVTSELYCISRIFHIRHITRASQKHKSSRRKTSLTLLPKGILTGREEEMCFFF